MPSSYSPSSGSVPTNVIPITNKEDGEYDEGKYRVWVASGKGNLYYDESAPVYYQANTSTGIHDVIEGTGFGISVNGGNIQVDGIKAGYTVTCTSAAGVQLYTAEARSGSLNFQVPAGTGMAIISVSGEGKTHRSKIIIK